MTSDSVAATPFASLAAMRAAHAELLKRHRAEGETPAFAAAIAQFLDRSQVAGALLVDEDDRWTAQSLLDYWTTTLYRAGTPTRSYQLWEFDPNQAPTLLDAACPYLGLDPFNEAQAGQFFGRRRVIAALVECLQRHRLIAVVGPSGSGKSSTVRAGLLSALRQDAIPGSAGWTILPPMVPGSDPLAALERTLEAGHVAQTSDNDARVLIIDQFEETFTLCSDDTRRQEFLRRVVALAADVAGGRVVLTMRSDFEPFVARAETLQPLYEAGKVTLPPLTTAELREAIERPAEQVGLKFEVGLVDTLLGDILGEPAGLPLLQYSLLKLWESRQRNRVTLDIYKKVGGGRLALARGADAVYNGLIPEEQLTAKRILLRLVRPGEGLEVTSNRLRRAELDRGGEDPSRVERVLMKFVDARLLRLTTGDRPEDAQVEVAHEALVRNWPTLVEWLEDERVALRLRQRLQVAAEQWRRLRRDASALLAGRLLEEAQQYEDLSELEREFVGAGVAAEVAQARRAARNSRLILTLAVLAVIFGLVATMLAVEASNGRADALASAAIAQTARADADQQRSTAEANGQVADQQRSTAEANGQVANQQRATAIAAQALAETAQAQTEQQRKAVEIAFKARDLLRSSPELALLLSIEALKRDRNPITSQTLRDTLAASTWASITLIGHTNRVSTIAISADGQMIVTGSNDNTARIWDTTGRQIASLTGHTQPINSVAFSPDGRRIVTTSQDNTVRMWDRNGTELARLTAHTAAVAQATFSPDGLQVLTASWDFTARLWRPADGTSKALTGHTGPVVRARFSSDGQYILTASLDRTARLWNAAGNQIKVLASHGDEVLDVAFSPDVTRVATASRDGYARLWTMSGVLLATLKGHAGQVNSVQFSPDGQRLLTASDDATTRLWDLEGKELAICSGHTREVVGAWFSPDGRRILTASADNSARLWDLKGQQISTLDGHTLGVTAVLFSPDGQHILSASADHTAQYWSLTGQEIGTLGGQRLGVLDVSINPSGDQILTASWDGTAKLWKSSGEEITEFKGHSAGIIGATFAPLSGRVLTASDDGTARLWDDQGRTLQEFKGHRGGIIGATFSPDGQRLVTISFDSTALLWTISGQQLAVMQHNGVVVSAVFSPDGQRILTASLEGIARVWDLAGNEMLALKNPDGREVVSALFSPDGTLILTSSRSGNAYLWDLTGREVSTLSGHLAASNAVFSPDGQTILTVSWDRTARLWDLQGRQLAVFVGHSGVIVSGVFSPDGQTILTASWDHTARLWSRSGELLATFNGHRDRVVRAIFSPDGQRVLTASWDGTARQYLVDMDQSRQVAECRAGRSLIAEEIARFQIPTPLAFDSDKRVCPSAYWWGTGQ